MLRQPLTLESLEGRITPSVMLPRPQLPPAHCCIIHQPAPVLLGVDAGPSTKLANGSIVWVHPTFNWKAVNGPVFYEVRLYEGNRLLQRTLTDNTHWSTTIPIGVTIKWEVIAVGRGISSPAIGLYHAPGPVIR